MSQQCVQHIFYVLEIGSKCCGAAGFAALLGPAWLVIIFRQNPPRVAFQIFVLIVAQAPQERGKASTTQDQRHRDQKNENVHTLPFSRRAFSNTVIEDADMAIEAISGVAKPASAIGTAMTL